MPTGFKSSHHEFCSTVEQCRPDIGVVGQYITRKTPIMFKHLPCGYLWKTTPAAILKGKSCPICRFRDDENNFIEKMQRLRPDILVLGTYVDNLTKVLVKHAPCGYEWYAKPSDIYSSKKCPQCCRRTTHDEFVAAMKICRPDITILGTYLNYHSDIKVRHNCGHEWNSPPKYLKYMVGCPVCNATTTETIRTMLSSVRPDIELVENYVDAKTKLKFKHLPCGTTFNEKPNNVLNSKSCPHCRREVQKKSHGVFLADLKRINPEILVLEQYRTSKEKILVRHESCGHEWNVKPNALLSGQSCPKCKRSVGERTIQNILTSAMVDFKIEKTFDGCRHKRLLPFDFWLTGYNICIEYQGIQHFFPIEWFGGKRALAATKRRDDIKQKYCRDNNIRLIYITYLDDISTKMSELISSLQFAGRTQ